MSEQRLREIAERERRATKGEWELWDGCSWRRIGIAGTLDTVICPTNDHYDHHPDLLARYDDLRFVVSARKDIPWLLANTTNALAYCDRILSHNPSGAELMFLTEVKRILTGESDGRPIAEGSDVK